MKKNTNKIKEDTDIPKEQKKRGRKAKNVKKEISKPIIVNIEYSTKKNPFIIEFTNIE